MLRSAVRQATNPLKRASARGPGIHTSRYSNPIGSRNCIQARIHACVENLASIPIGNVSICRSQACRFPVNRLNVQAPRMAEYIRHDSEAQKSWAFRIMAVAASIVIENGIEVSGCFDKLRTGDDRSSSLQATHNSSMEDGS
jgi:hypothetical protein